MSKQGFVYILGNGAMPGRYKVGFTQSSPFQRAEELSRATGVPTPFEVIAFVACVNPSDVEAWMHRKFAAVNVGKEFFGLPVGVLWEALREHDAVLGACDVEVAPWDYLDRPEAYQEKAA